MPSPSENLPTKLALQVKVSLSKGFYGVKTQRTTKTLPEGSEPSKCLFEVEKEEPSPFRGTRDPNGSLSPAEEHQDARERQNLQIYDMSRAKGGALNLIAQQLGPDACCVRRGGGGLLGVDKCWLVRLWIFLLDAECFVVLFGE